MARPPAVALMAVPTEGPMVALMVALVAPTEGLMVALVAPTEGLMVVLVAPTEAVTEAYLGALALVLVTFAIRLPSTGVGIA